MIYKKKLKNCNQCLSSWFLRKEASVECFEGKLVMIQLQLNKKNSDTNIILNQERHPAKGENSKSRREFLCNINHFI